MADNYRLGSKFGFNVAQQNGNKLQQKAEQIEETVGNLFESMTNYFAKYENVFTGEFANEINSYSRQAMIVGMNLKASDGNIRKFDMNI